MPDMMGWMAGWMMALTFLIPVVFFALLALLVVWVIRSSRDTNGAEAPLTILQRRYARGDLGTDEYERMRAALRKE